MKIAFITGIKFIEFEGKYYAVTFSQELIAQRYLPVFENFTVFGDVSPGKNQTPGCMMLSSGNNVIFKFQKSAKRPMDYILKANAIKKEIQELLFGVDGAIIRLPSLLGLLACDVCRGAGKPYLVELVGCPWDSLWNHSWRGKILAPFVFRRTRHCVRNAAYVVYTSKKFLQSKYPTRGQSTHASNVMLCDFDKSTLRIRLCKIASRKKTMTIGSCGQIDLPFKGHKLVIEAISIMNRNGYDFCYELVGSGNPEYIMNIARSFNIINKIKILGRKQQKDVFRWLDTIDIYAQPSLTEGMPRSLVEAMSRGVPCIGSDAGAIPELLPSYCLFSNKNVKSLIKTLQDVDNRLIETAIKVFARAKKFSEKKIEPRRKEIFESFRNSIILPKSNY